MIGRQINDVVANEGRNIKMNTYEIETWHEYSNLELEQAPSCLQMHVT